MVPDTEPVLKKTLALRSSLVAQRVKDLALHCCGFYGMGLIPGLGTSACCRGSQKKNVNVGYVWKSCACHDKESFTMSLGELLEIIEEGFLFFFFFFFFFFHFFGHTRGIWRVPG